MTTATTETTDRRLPAAALVGGAFALTTLLTIVLHVGEILFTDHDPHAPEGPIASIESVALVGGVGLVVALAIALPLSRDPSRAHVGAIVLGVLAVVSLGVFWSGVPASLGAAAAWLGGLARGSQPQTGVARGFGIVGLVIVVLEVVASVATGIAGAFVG